MLTCENDLEEVRRLHFGAPQLSGDNYNNIGGCLVQIFLFINTSAGTNGISQNQEKAKTAFPAPSRSDHVINAKGYYSRLVDCLVAGLCRPVGMHWQVLAIYNARGGFLKSLRECLHHKPYYNVNAASRTDAHTDRPSNTPKETQLIIQRNVFIMYGLNQTALVLFKQSMQHMQPQAPSQPSDSCFFDSL